MESWLPWLAVADRLVTDVLPATAKVVLVEPRRSRDRAVDLIAEEDDLAKALASTWERSADLAFPRLHAEPDRLLTGLHGSFWSIDSVPESPATPIVEVSGWGPVAGDGSGFAARLTTLLRDGYRVIVAADGAGSAGRLPRGIARPRPRPADRRRGGRSHEAGRPDRRRPAPSRRHRRGGQGRHRRRERPHRTAPDPPPAPAHVAVTAACSRTLVVLYAKRTHSPGYAYGPDTPWQRELEEASPMRRRRTKCRPSRTSSATWSDRSRWTGWCAATSGYGKTEVAVRAAFKAVHRRKQVAVLVPTTVLARSTSAAFRERLDGFPGPGGDVEPVPRRRRSRR